MPEGRVFLATTEYDRVTYGSNLAQITAGMNEASISISVFDTTSDSSVLQIERLHIFFEFPAPDTVRVIQLMLLANPSGQTVVGPDAETPALTIQLPEGATNLSLQESMRLYYLQAENGFAIDSVRPSTEAYEITYAFDMPYEKEKLDLALPLPLDTMASVIVVPEEGVKLKGEKLLDGGVRDLQGVPYRSYNTHNMAAGDELSFSLSGLPGSGSDWFNTEALSASTSLVVGLGAFGVVLIAVGIYLWQRNRQVEEDWDEVDQYDEAPSEADETPEDLMDAIIALDDLYKTGELPEQAYQQRRVELKARLKEMIGNSG
jgi:hypothetical protein